MKVKREQLRKIEKESEYKIIAHWIHKECNNPIGEIRWLLRHADEILSFSDDSVRNTYEEVLIEKHMKEQYSKDQKKAMYKKSTCS